MKTCGVPSVLAIVVFAVAPVLGGCGTGAPAASQIPAANRDITLVVHNRDWLDVNVYRCTEVAGTAWAPLEA